MRANSRNPTTVVRRIILLAVVLLAAYVAGRAIYIEASKSRLYAAGRAAAAAGQWTEAFVQFNALVELDPAYRNAHQQLDQLVPQVMQADPSGNDQKAQIILLRWLAASSEWTQLAQVLDRSVAGVPAGEFVMGSNAGRDDEHPRRLVYMDAFEIDRFEVTNVQYQRFLQATEHESPPYWSGNEYPRGQADHPVVGVSWADADSYCAWAGKRLPTEAEWEKSCRSDDGRIYPWGSAWSQSRANIDASAGAFRPANHTGPRSNPWEAAWVLLQASSGVRSLRPIGSYTEGASPYGIMDLVGNASEWVADWYNWNGYWDWPARNPVGTQPPWNRSVRGSAWYDPNGSAQWVQGQSQCSARNSSHETRDPRTGFRCARSFP